MSLIDVLQIAVVLLTMFIGSTVQTTCGFGNGILVMAIVPFFLPFGQSAALSSMASVLLSSLIAFRDRRYLRHDVLWPVLLVSIAVSSLVIFFAVGKSEKLLLRMLGVLLILLSIYFMYYNGRIRIRPTLRNGIISGILGGIGGGLFSIAAPPIVIYFLSAIDSKEGYRATTVMYFAVNSFTMTLTRAANGIVTWPLMKIFFLMSFSIIAGVWLGNKIFNRINIELLRRIIYAVMAVSGVVMLL